MASELQGCEEAATGEMTTKVVLICGIDPSKEAASGVFAYTIGLAKALAKSEVQVKLVGIGSPGSLQSHGIDFVAVQERPTTSIQFLLSLMKAAPALNLSADTVIHAQRPDDLVPFCVFNPENPKVVTLHGSHADSIRVNKGDVAGQIYDQIESYALKRSGRIICVSKSTLSRFRGKYLGLSGRMKLVYAGLDLDELKPAIREGARAQLGLPASAKVLLYAGRLVEEKRVDVILKAFKQVEDKNEEAMLILVGGGKDEDALKNLTNSLSLKRVKFLPTAARSRLCLLISAADAVVIASKQEGLPTIAMESLACGTPVVSTPVGIVPEIVRDGVNGFLVSNIETLPEILEKALATSSSLSKNCVEAVRRFSWESIVKEVMAVYNEAS